MELMLRDIRHFFKAHPTLDEMRALLESNGLDAPRSGSACVKLIWENRDTVRLAPPPPSRDLGALDLETQCENGILAEAEERLKSCIQSSFNTDNGRIMLENDLLLFDFASKDEWLRETMNEWLPRLKSTFHDEFILAINLWVLSQKDIQ